MNEDVIRKTDVLKAIQEEPEYPGDAPPELMQYIRKCIENKDEFHMLHMLRMSVRQIKKCIIDRIEAL